MQSPVQSHQSLDVPHTVERRRRGRGLDVMGVPTPDHQTHLPTPVTQRRKPADGASSSTHLPTPQTLPRKRKAVDDHADDDDDVNPLPSPSGQTTFVLSHSSTDATESSTVVRRRPGLLFAQQMGLVSGPSAQPAKFGGRLGPGIGMGGGMRHGHGQKENPFLVDAEPHTSAPLVQLTGPRSPGANTRYVPQLIRPSAERSLSPHPKARPRKLAHMLVAGRPDNSSASSSRRRPQLIDDKDSPFRTQPGEVIRARPTSEDNPLVTYVFRGARKVFANPFVRPDTAYPPAELDPTHPEYDPHPCPEPRLLWPTKEPKAQKPSAQTPVRPRRRSRDEMEMDVSDSEFEDDFVAVEQPRRGLLFGGSATASKRSSGASSSSSNKRPRLSDSDL